MRIVFIGTGDIGLPSLEALINPNAECRMPNAEVVGVVTQPDKPVGRKQVLTPSQIKVRALAAGVPVLQPERIKAAVDELAALHADVFVVVAYGQILSRTVLDLPRLACLNIHASLLPRHRGAAPIQAAIRDGDAETGITIMWMEEGLDTGDVLLMEKLPICADDTGGVLHDKLAAMAPKCLLSALQKIAEGTAPRIPQDHANATIVRKLERAHGAIDWSMSAEKIERLIRAYDPWPGTYCVCPVAEGKTSHLKVYRARVVESAEACPLGGTVLSASERLLVSCGKGVLELLEVQLEGRKRMSALEFLRGQKLEAGSVLQ
jgi:methionyl-tRNA formyltransferase